MLTSQKESIFAFLFPYILSITSAPKTEQTYHSLTTSKPLMRQSQQKSSVFLVCWNV